MCWIASEELIEASPGPAERQWPLLASWVFVIAVPGQLDTSTECRWCLDAGRGAGGGVGGATLSDGEVITRARSAMPRR